MQKADKKEVEQLERKGFVQKSLQVSLCHSTFNPKQNFSYKPINRESLDSENIKRGINQALLEVLNHSKK